MARVNAIPETVNISELRQRQNELLGRLETGPVLLMQYSTPAALLVGVDQWNRLADDLEDLEDAVTALKMQLALCLLYTSPSPRDGLLSRMPSSA